MSLQTHLAILEKSVSRFTSSYIFKLPHNTVYKGVTKEWKTITYLEFYNDIQRVAKHWVKVLGSSGVPAGAVVGIWVTGWSYSDMVTAYAVSRAGYVPQFFSLRLPNPDVVFELLNKAGSKALIHEPSLAENLKHCPVPIHCAVDPEMVYKATDDIDLPSLNAPVCGEDIAFIFHTSGSTSGSPKLVPCNHRWLDNIITKANEVCAPKKEGCLDTVTWMGAVVHIAETFMFMGFLQHGACTILPTQPAFGPNELADMIQHGGLTRLNIFGSFLTKQINNSYSDGRLLELLQSLDEILYSGLSIGQEEEEFAYANGLLLKNLLGSTECGAMLLSIGGRGSDARLLRPLRGVSYGFFPVDAAAESETKPTNRKQLLELVILSSSGDCPDLSLRSDDGHYHIGDLFEEVAPGSYLYRGRNDDWIKTESALRCDTKSIEDSVLATCGDLVHGCIVVGNGRPSPALFVEPKSDTADYRALKTEIYARIQGFNTRRYIHERIASENMIVIVERGSLPRTSTKGNIRRKAVEAQFKTQLDQLYN